MSHAVGLSVVLLEIVENTRHAPRGSSCEPHAQTAFCLRVGGLAV